MNFKFQVPNLMPISLCRISSQRIRPDVQALCSISWRLGFYRDELLATSQTSQHEDHPLSAVRDCLFSIFAATLHIWRPFSPSITWGRAMFRSQFQSVASCRGCIKVTPATRSCSPLGLWYIVIIPFVWHVQPRCCGMRSSSCEHFKLHEDDVGLEMWPHAFLTAPECCFVVTLTLRPIYPCQEALPGIHRKLIRSQIRLGRRGEGEDICPYWELDPAVLPDSGLCLYVFGRRHRLILACGAQDICRELLQSGSGKS
jgi:hypothetical protein